MKKGVLLFGLFFLVLCTAGALGLVLAPELLDPNSYKSDIIREVKRQTGRNLRFDGDLSIALRPWLGVDLGPIALSNAEGFGPQPFLEARHSSIQVQLLPLINRDLRIQSLMLDGVSLNLARNKHGQTNWEDITEFRKEKTERAAQKDKSTSEKHAESSPKEKTNSGFSLTPESFAIADLQLKNASLCWDDAVENRKLILDQLNLNTGAMAPGRDFDLDISGRIAHNDKEGIVQLTSTANIDKNFRRQQYKNAAFSITAKADEIAKEGVQAEIHANILIDLNEGSFSVENLDLKTPQAEITGVVTAEKLNSAPEYAADLVMTQVKPRALLKLLQIPVPKTADPKALSAGALKISATGGMDFLNILSLQLNLDDTTVSGHANIKSFREPNLSFALKGDSLDLNRYLPPAQKKGNAAPKNAKGKATSKDNTPTKDTAAEKHSAENPVIDFLRHVTMEGTVQLGEFRFKKLRLNNIKGTVKARDGLIRINPLSTDFSSGKLVTDAQGDFRGKTPRNQLVAKARNVDLGKALTDLAGKDYVTGRVDLNINARANGFTWHTVRRSLNGNAKLVMKNGVFRGFSIIPEPVKQAAIEKSPSDISGKIQKQQPYERLSSDFTVRNGLLQTKNTRVTAPRLSGQGAGTLDLRGDYQLNYNAIISITALPRIPFTVTGPVYKPTYSLDTVQFLKETAYTIMTSPLDVGKKALDVGEDVGKGTIDVGKDILDGINKGLQNIFGGDKKK